MMNRLWRLLFGDPLPVIKEMPDHIRDMKLDIDLIGLSMENTHMPNPAVNPNRFTIPKA